MAQSNITLTKFSGGDSENWNDFEALLRSTMDVADVQNARRPGFLKLHLEGAALQFFQTLDNATQTHLENAITALRNHYCHPQLTELHKIKFENLHFNLKTVSPEDFLVKLQTVAQQAYPQPAAAVIAPSGGGADQARFDRETRDELERQRTATSERERLVKRHFIKNMPNWIKLKLLDQPENATVQDLCTLARKRLILNELCPTDDVTRDAFSEVQPHVTENLVNALTRLTESQNSMESQISALAKDLNDKITLLETQTTTRNPQNIAFEPRHRPPNYQNQQSGYPYRPYASRTQPYNARRGFSGQPRYGYQNNARYGHNNTYSQGFRGPHTYQYHQNANTNGTPYFDSTGNARFHLPVINSAQTICQTCGYPNHTARNCIYQNKPYRNAQLPFATNGHHNSHPKN